MLAPNSTPANVWMHRIGLLTIGDSREWDVVHIERADQFVYRVTVAGRRLHTDDLRKAARRSLATLHSLITEVILDALAEVPPAPPPAERPTLRVAPRQTGMTWRTNTSRIDIYVGRVTMTPLRMRVLTRLFNAKRARMDAQDCSDFNIRTLKPLAAKGFIELEVSTRTAQITETGERIYKLFMRPGPNVRRDNLCPNCGVRPRRFTSAGLTRGYCRECAAEYSRRARRRIMHQPPLLCPRCKQRLQHVWSTGRHAEYCHECSKELKREYMKGYRRRKKAERLQQAGD